MGKKIVFGLIILLIVMVVFVFWIGSWFFSSYRDNQNPAGASPYTAVYMTTGDIYFGKFSRFPKPHMTDVWFLQRTVGQNNQQQFGILPFSSAFWGPVNDVNFNESQILFWARLRNDSQVVKTLKDPSLIGQSGVITPQEGQSNPQGNTFQGPSDQPPVQK